MVDARDMKSNISLAESLVGLTEEEAVAKITDSGMRVRVRSKDGESFMGTCDYRMDRVNLHIENGKVTKASIG